MRNSLSTWLFSVIVLTILAVLVVFKPITFSPRKDPSDASRFLRPIGVAKFDPELPPVTGTFSAFGTSVYLYPPQHDIRLGLDLRGGIRVVLEIPDRAVFNYTIAQAKAPASLDDSAKLQTEIGNTLADPKLLGPDAVDPSKSGFVKIRVNEGDLQIITMPVNEEDAKRQYECINKALDKLLGADQYTAPKLVDAFDPSKLADQRAAIQKNVLGIMQTRLNEKGTSELTAYSEGQNHVVLEIPGVKDPDRVNAMIKTTAQLEFRLLPEDINVISNPDTGKETFMRGTQKLTDDQVIRESFLVLSGDSLEPNSGPTYNTQHQPAVSFSIKPDKQSYFGAITNKFKAPDDKTPGRLLAIVLDNKIVMAPEIKGAISESGIIEGGSTHPFTMQEVTDMSTLLNAGALPVPVKIVEKRTVSATLGADSVAKSMLAGGIGLALVLIFMAAYYRLPGLMADLALLVYIALSLAVLKLFDATLTLPGIAGIIISIGMAVDANVIIFERLKEELRTQKPLGTAIDVAFQRAWTAILDSNVASLITGSVLYALGTGAVRGFAVTLIIGVAVSLFTAVTVTRLFMKLMIRSRAAHNMAWYGV